MISGNHEVTLSEFYFLCGEAHLRTPIQKVQESKCLNAFVSNIGSGFIKQKTALETETTG